MYEGGFCVFAGLGTCATAVVCMWSFISAGRRDVDWSIEKKKKRTEEIRWRVSVDSLLLFAFASLSARPFQTPASRSPGGTPPSSASRAGTPRSCHTCRGKDMYDITVLARPLKFTLPVHVWRRTTASIHQGPGPLFSQHWCLRRGGGGCKGKEHVNKMSLRRRYDYGARRKDPRECRRAARLGSQAAATVSTTSHVITFCLVRASSRRKVQLSPAPQTSTRRVR